MSISEKHFSASQIAATFVRVGVWQDNGSLRALPSEVLQETGGTESASIMDVRGAGY